MFLQLMEQINEANVTINAFFNQYYGDKLFFGVTCICFVYLFWVYEELRYKFLVPVGIILLVVVNPILYHYIFSKIIYWRLFWMIPNVTIMGASVVILLKRQKKVWMKWSMLIISAVFIICFGNNTFQNDSFTWIQNWEKISQDTVEVCDIIVLENEKPRVIFPNQIYVEVRQYMPEIDMMYGRNVSGYIRGIEGNALDIYHQMVAENRNYEYILSRAIDCAYNFVVVESDREIQSRILHAYGYRECGRTERYIVYYNENVRFE